MRNPLLVLVFVMLVGFDMCAGLFFPFLKHLKSYGLTNSRRYGYANGYGSYGGGYGGGYGSYGGGYGGYGGGYGGYGGGYGRYGGGYGGYGGGYRSRGNQRPSRGRTGRTYSDIARVINANPYAFVGQRPFPAQPFYPSG